MLKLRQSVSTSELGISLVLPDTFQSEFLPMRQEGAAFYLFHAAVGDFQTAKPISTLL